MGWFDGGRGPHRWSAAVHEASHVVAVRHFGGRVRAWLHEGGRTGEFAGTMPDATPAVADAVVLLAGGVGQKLIVGRGEPSVSDLSGAKRALRGTGVSRQQAQREAKRLIRANRRAVVKEAQRLYRDGSV